ncbi:MAG: succinylglutamic semialdehyde dehydrogenase [Myxococcaceae bacterium]|nr:succinylglutamic semialdehyde dehydrogenase [Myxococcaceae bacterium]
MSAPSTETRSFETLAGRGDYLGGRFVAVPPATADGVIERVSPRDFADVVGRYLYREQAVDQAVAHARAAFPAWSLRPLEERSALLRELKRVIAARAAEFALLLTREIGKPLWEAESEVSAALAKIDVTLSDGLALVQAREMGSRAQRYAFKPHGVAAVLGPFNFPLHLVHGHVVPALVTGNTVVVKPSELAPGVGQLYAECFDAAGFPAGVFNLVQGAGASGARLAAHPDVDVVMLTGSYAVGQSVKRATLEQPHKLLALELGGRNPAIVLADADLDKAVHDVLWGAFVTAGQRCSGTAVALVERSLFEPFAEKLQAKLAGLRVGDPLAPGVFMGPLISDAARARYLAALDSAERAGVELLARGAIADVALAGAYVEPTVHRLGEPKGNAYERDELFGPDLALELVDDLEHAIQRANDSPYGLSASVFGASEIAFEHALARLRHGCVNWNAPTCGASSRLPFGGTGKSGNHRPAALFSTLYATYPVASIRGPLTLDSSKLSPGFSW